MRRERKMPETKTKYDLMKEADKYEEDAYFPEDFPRGKSKRDEYFEFYDDIKTSIKEDW